MPLPNKRQLKLIFYIVLGFLLDCYIFWNMKNLLLLMFKLVSAINQILSVYGVNLLEYLSDKSALLIEFIKRKLFSPMKDNAMMKRYLDNRDYFIPFRPNLILELSNELEIRKKYEGEIGKIAENHREQNEKENTKESKKLKIN